MEIIEAVQYEAISRYNKGPGINLDEAKLRDAFEDGAKFVLAKQRAEPLHAKAQCAACDEPHEMFFVPNDVWQTIDDPSFHNVILCWSCFFAAYCLALAQGTAVHRRKALAELGQAVDA